MQYTDAQGNAVGHTEVFDSRFMSHAEVMRLIAAQAEHHRRYADETAHSIAQREVATVLAQRQQAEDVRANKRNRNRSLTLIVALGMFFIVPPGMQALGLAAYLVYAPVIAIFPDALITLYAYIKKY